jgi:drug/metabolite transporter (DMT)-like permease
MTWILLSILAGLLQTIRNATSKSIAKMVSPMTVTFVRFFYALPFTLIAYGVLMLTNQRLGNVGSDFWVHILLGTLYQAVANTLLVMLMKSGKFATAVAYSKLELVFLVLIQVLLFGTIFSGLVYLGIALALVGVMAMTVAKSGWGIFKSFTKETVMGGFCGLLFGLAVNDIAISIKNISGGSNITNSVFALLISLLIHIFFTGGYILWKNPADIKTLRKTYKTDFIIGLASALASICWFVAYTIVNPALVRTVGQVEFGFTLLVSTLFFKEKIKKLELIGLVLICVAVILIGMNR